MYGPGAAPHCGVQAVMRDRHEIIPSHVMRHVRTLCTVHFINDPYSRHLYVVHVLFDPHVLYWCIFAHRV